MMDVHSANQSQTPGQDGWPGHRQVTTASPPGPAHNALPSFQHLNLCSASDQTPCYNQGFQRDLSTFLPRNDTVYSNNADWWVQQMTPDASPVGPASSQGRNMPPCLLPSMNEGMQHCKPQQMSLHSSHKVISPVSPPPHAHQSSLNGPQSLLQAHLPFNPAAFGHSLKEGSPQSPQAAFEKTAGCVNHAAFPSSPVHLQPQWTPHSAGTISDFVPSAAQDRIVSQSPVSESRYGLDPELLPSAVKVMAEDRAEWEGKVFISEPFSPLPPLATTSCITADGGSASPSAVRSTTYCVPCEGQTALLSRLPLGALITPLAKQNPAEKLLPACEESECMVGCGGCGASMCSAMGWQDCGQRFYCPFCGELSEVPWQHYQRTKGVEGVRVDKDTRPELSMGSYEILGSQKGEPAALLLAIDVSASALRGGHLDFITQQIHTLLTSLNSGGADASSDIRVGLMTYDNRIHLYDLSPALSRPHMLVIAEDTDELQLPVREGLLVPLRDGIHGVSSVLQLVPQLNPECDESSGVSTELPVKAGLALLQALNCHGKLLIFHTAPLIETGHTDTSSGLFGSNKPKSIFQPSELNISLAKQCVHQGCGVHLFVLSQQDVGGAWPGHIPYLTGGALHQYSQLQGELDRECFSADMKRTIGRDTGYKAELRIYVSKDMRVSGSYGMFVPGPSPGRIAMATVDGQTTLAVELAHSRALEEKRGVTIQAVLSYSTQTGDMRTRVHTLTLRCSRQHQDTFRHYQAQTLLAFYCKKMYCAVLERPLQELREELQAEATQVLASYRKHCCSAAVSAGQLVLPQQLRALPVYINSLRKSEVLLPGLRSSVHQRLQQRCQVLSMDACSTTTHFYPALLPLPLSADSSCPPNPEEALRCSGASLDPRGLFLLHAPLTLLLWVGNQLPASTLVGLFNTSCFSSLPSGETTLPPLENRLSVRIRSLINTLNSQMPFARKLWVVKQGDACEEALQRQLVEDKSPNGGASYADFLYHLHVNSVRMLQ